MAESQEPRPLLECPKCAGRMQSVVFAGVEVDRCLVCRGIWFDADELAALAKAPGSDQVDDGSPFIGELKDGRPCTECPRCKVMMAASETPKGRKFKLERCPGCKGVFLDAGEFTDLKLDQSFWEQLAKG